MSKFRIARLGTVAVAGASMTPTFNNGDWLLVKWFGSQARAYHVGDIVVVEREVQPGIRYIKRISEITERKIYLLSDNPEGTDSRQWGSLDATEIQAQVLLRIRRAKKLQR